MTAQLATLIQTAIGPEYRVDQELDGGGMSRLFLATDLRHNRRVVVKVLTPELMTEQSTARFKREIELTVRLQHPHILPILTSGAWEDTLYYITPFIPGESLKARIARDGKLPLDDIVKILRDVSGALAFAHQRGIVHRDIKPGNVLLADGHAILADFGIARAVSTTATPLTGSGMVPGTPAYMAPELPTDEKADVYSLGVVGCEIFTGRIPPRGITARELLEMRGAVINDVSGVATWLAGLLERSVSTKPESRFTDASEVSAAISHRPIAKSRVPAVLSVVGASLLAAAIAMLWILTRTPATDPQPRSPYVVLPVVGESSHDSVLAADLTERLRDAVAEWREDTLGL